MAYYDEEQNKLAFRDWKVFIDNSSEWFDDINKKLCLCYEDTNMITRIYPQIRTFASSRVANLDNFKEIDNKLNEVRHIIYSEKYKEMRNNKSSGNWDNKILIVLDRIIQMLSIGLSEGELTPKTTKQKTYYEKENNVNDFINDSLIKTNNTLLKNGKITTNNT